MVQKFPTLFKVEIQESFCFLNSSLDNLKAVLNNFTKKCV